MKKIKRNFYNIIIFIIFFFLTFIDHFYFNSLNEIKFGKIGSNYFLKKYHNSLEYENYLKDVYQNFSKKNIEFLCTKAVTDTFLRSQIALKILKDKNIKSC